MVGLKAQLEHGKESPPTETTVDLLGATFNTPESDLDLDASDRFKTKAGTKLRQSRDEGQWNLVGCESVTYTCNHAAQLSITEGLCGNEATSPKLGAETTHLAHLPGRSRIVDRQTAKGATRPMGTSTMFPERGHPRTVDPEMGAPGNIGFGAACPLPGGIVLFFYGKWTQQHNRSWRCT